VNACTAQLVESAEIVSAGTGECGHAAIYCVLCEALPHCQHSAAPLLLSCTVTLAHSGYKTVQ